MIEYKLEKELTRHNVYSYTGWRGTKETIKRKKFPCLGGPAAGRTLTSVDLDNLGLRDAYMTYNYSSHGGRNSPPTQIFVWKGEVGIN